MFVSGREASRCARAATGVAEARFADETVHYWRDPADHPGQVGHTAAATQRTALSRAARSLGVSDTLEGIGSITHDTPHTGRFLRRP